MIIGLQNTKIVRRTINKGTKVVDEPFDKSNLYGEEFDKQEQKRLELGTGSNDFSLKTTNIVDTSNISVADYLVAFSGNTENYCVGLVDMVNSTKMAAILGNGKISQYYEVFLNSMSKILSRFGGFVIKNVGDCLVYYFPESSKPNRKFGFMSCLECSLAMIEYHDTICKRGDGDLL